MKPISLRALYQQYRARGMSMRRRFVLCLLLALFAVLAIMMLLLNVFGVLRPAEDELAQTLTQQLDFSADHISTSMEHLAAQAVAFSDELAGLIEETGVPFEELDNDQEALTALQTAAYDTVYSYMRRSSCSGAFFFLNATVNSALADTYYDGIYLKYANLSSDTTVRNSVRMYRGSAHVARENDINLHSTWEFELKAGTFPQLEAVLHPQPDAPAQYLLTTVYKLPDAWERVRFLCVPVKDTQGRVIGVCGYEISDLYFQFSYQTADGEQSRAVCALMTGDGSRYAGQVAGNRSGYAPDLDGPLTVSKQGKFSLVSNGDNDFVGVVKLLDIGQSQHMVAALLPDGIYDTYVRQQQSKTVLLLAAVSALAVGLSLFLGNRYVTPLLRSMEQVKTEQLDSATRIPEVNELLAYLAERDRLNESTLDEIRREQVSTQASLAQLQTEHDRLQERLRQLAQSKKDEVYPEEYTYFLRGIEDLSEKERAVFDCYLRGLSTRDIAATLNISEDGVRYHNKNIYAKLGVKGLKQMKLFISILQQDISPAQ